MKIVLVKGAEKSLTAQIYDQIRDYALNREDKAEEKLPSIRALAVELGVSVITVKNAYEMLEKDGFVYTRAGSGVYFGSLEQSQLDRIRQEQQNQAVISGQKAIALGKQVGLAKEFWLMLIEQIYREN